MTTHQLKMFQKYLLCHKVNTVCLLCGGLGGHIFGDYTAARKGRDHVLSIFLSGEHVN